MRKKNMINYEAYLMLRDNVISASIRWMQEQVYQEYAGGPTERLISNERIKDYSKQMQEKFDFLTTTGIKNG